MESLSCCGDINNLHPGEIQCRPMGGTQKWNPFAEQHRLTKVATLSARLVSIEAPWAGEEGPEIR